MTSHDIARYLQAYCDGELEASRMLDVETHLETCPSCWQAVETEKAFRAELSAKVAREHVPPRLAERLSTRIAEEERPGRLVPAPVWSRRVWAVALAASIAFFVLGGVLGYMIAERESIPGVHPLVIELVSEHMKFALLEDPAELSSRNTEQVAFWVERQTGHSVRVPDYSPSGIRLLGGRVTALGGRRAAYIVYEKGRSIISLFSFPEYEASLSGLKEMQRYGRTFLTGEYQMRHVVLWESEKMTYALVSDVGWDELLKCAGMFFKGSNS